jgi:hypothetical protein
MVYEDAKSPAQILHEMYSDYDRDSFDLRKVRALIRDARESEEFLSELVRRLCRHTDAQRELINFYEALEQGGAIELTPELRETKAKITALIAETERKLECLGANP